MNRIKKKISCIMRREAELSVFLLLNELNQFIEPHVEQKEAEATPLKDTLANGNTRGGKVISNNESCHKD